MKVMMSLSASSTSSFFLHVFSACVDPDIDVVTFVELVAGWWLIEVENDDDDDEGVDSAMPLEDVNIGGDTTMMMVDLRFSEWWLLKAWWRWWRICRVDVRMMRRWCGFVEEDAEQRSDPLMKMEEWWCGYGWRTDSRESFEVGIGLGS